MAGTIEQIARVIYAANREYCGTIGDHSFECWENALPWQRETCFNGVKAALDSMRLGEQFEPAVSHQLWMHEKLSQGWAYGPVKDHANKEHPCLVPYGQLPPEQKLKDHLFGAIVEAFFFFKMEVVEQPK
jgi:hypothetical protein